MTEAGFTLSGQDHPIAPGTLIVQSKSDLWDKIIYIFQG